MYIDYYNFIEKQVLEIELLKLKRDKAKLESKIFKDMLKQLPNESKTEFNESKIKKCCDTCKNYYRVKNVEANPEIKICMHEKHYGYITQDFTVCDEWEEK